jgi:hypothetical protein
MGRARPDTAWSEEKLSTLRFDSPSTAVTVTQLESGTREENDVFTGRKEPLT